jgi:hypothetical protein
MEKPIISLYGSSNRPQNWLDFYNRLQDNSIPFEVMFAGPNKPDFILPDNFIHIKTADIKPAQCVEVAARNTTGELIIQIADDIEFITSKALDILYEVYSTYNNDNLIVSCRFMQDKVDLSPTCHYYCSGDISSPILSVAGLMSNKLYKTIGGMDQNFIAVCGDIDVILRVHEYGGSVILSNVYVNENWPLDKENSLYTLYARIDRTLLNSLWQVNSDEKPHRLKPFEPFTDYKILEESQGPKDRWI